MTTAPAAGRKAPRPAHRRASQLVLAAGSLLALAGAFGPPWIVRLALVVAVGSAVLGCALAWRELAAARRAHAAAMLRASREHGSALRDERARNASVVDVLTARLSDSGARISRLLVLVEGLRDEVAELARQVATLHTRNQQLAVEVAHRETAIVALRDSVRAREAELLAWQHSDVRAEVHHMPRRVLVEPAPTAVDAEQVPVAPVAPVRLDVDEVAMVLPNYEVDRLVG